MKTTTGTFAAVVMSVALAACGADQSNDKTKSVNQTVRPDKATRSPAGQTGAQERSAEPRCRDHVVCGP